MRKYGFRRDCDCGDAENVVIAESPWNLQLPNLAIKNLYQGIEDRILWVEDIDTFTMESVAKPIIQYNKEDKGTPIEERKPIKLIFNSCGGDVVVMNSIVDIIMASETPVYGYNIALCCSAAAIIFLACDKRYTMPHAEYLLHQGSGAVQANTQQMFDMVENLKEIEAKIKSFVLDRTSIDSKLYNKNQRKEWYVEPEKQIELGISDSIIESLDELY